MLDFDLASRYNVETRRLKEQVRRNIERFPSDFMFQLSKHEWKELIANCDNLPQKIKYSPIKQELEAFMRETNSRLDKNDMKFDRIFKLFDQFIEHKKELEKSRTPIGFKQKIE